MTDTQRIVLTREAEQCRPWRLSLETAGLTVLSLPVIRFTTVSPPDDLDPSSYDWILFRSPQSVRAFWDAGLDAGEARLGVLGPGTAATLRACGHRCDLDTSSGSGAEMAAVFAAVVAPPGHILLPGPSRPLPEPCRSLLRTGFTVDQIPFYRTDAVPAHELPESPFTPGDLIFFASPSAVRACAAVWGADVPCVAIGETTAAAAREAGFAVAVAQEPTLEAMIKAAGCDPDSGPQTTEP